MAPQSANDPVEQLWKQAQELSYELGTALAETNEMWAEISSMFGDVFYEEGVPPTMIADYLAGSTQQLQFLQRATALLHVQTEINDRNQSMNVAGMFEKVNSAAAGIDWEYAKKLLDPETSAAFLAFKKTVDEYPRDLKQLQSSALIAVYTPIFFIRDAFAGYLDRPRPSATLFRFLLDLGEDGAMHLLKEGIPGLGLIKAIAKAGHEHSEGRYEKFRTGMKDQILFYRLKDSVDAGMNALRTTETFLSDWRVSENELTRKFTHAAGKCVDVMRFLGKDRAN